MITIFTRVTTIFDLLIRVFQISNYLWAIRLPYLIAKLKLIVTSLIEKQFRLALLRNNTTRIIKQT